MRLALLGLAVIWGAMFIGGVDVVAAPPAAPGTEVKMDASRVLVIVDTAASFPGNNRVDGHALAKLAGLTPREVRRYAAFAMKLPKNMPRQVGSFDVEIDHKIDAAEAQQAAAVTGAGTLVIVAFSNRVLRDVGSTTFESTGDITVAIRRHGETTWRKTISRPFRIASADKVDPDGDRPSDLDMLARAVDIVIREQMFEHVIKSRIVKTRPEPDGQAIELSITNLSGRTLGGVELSTPTTRDPIITQTQATIAPGATQIVTIKPAMDKPVSPPPAWMRSKLTDVRFESLR
jgi:hypothetical protein